jgi:SAM-dependent methyltransferase
LEQAYDNAELAELYDVTYRHEHDVALWSAVIDASGGSTALELGCGTGRALIPLARAGYEITGLDASEAMLERCRENLAEEAPDVRARVTLVHGDMTSFSLENRFDAVLCVFNSFHHLRAVDDQLGCLDACRSHLEPGGLLVLDLFNPDPVSEAPEEASDEAAGDAPVESLASEEMPWTDGRTVKRLMTSCEYDWDTQTNHCELTYEITEPDGGVRRVPERFPLRLVHRFELEHLLARSGFRLLQLYGDYDRSPFTRESVGMIAVALGESSEE